MYGSMEESPPAAEAPALGPAELKAVRKLLSATSSTNGSDVTDQPGLLHEPQELSTSTLAKLEAASDEVELQPSVWDSSLFLFNPMAGRSASLFAFLLLAVNVFLQGSFAFYLIDGLDDIDIRSILSFLVCLCLGYTYAGQVIFDKEALSSTYPDFYPFCSLYCGNTCCVPSDEWDGARAAAGD